MKNKKELEVSWEKFVQFLQKNKKYIFIFVVIALVCVYFRSGDRIKQELGYNEFIKMSQEGKIEKVTIKAQDTDTYKIEGENFSLTIRKEAKPENLELEEFFKKYAIDFVVKGKKGTSNWLMTLLIYCGMAFILFRLFLRPIGKALDQQDKHIDKYTKSSAKFTDAKTRQGIGQKVTFKDVAGLKEAKEELGEVIDFLKDPIRFTKLGGEVPRGVLLVGSPGTGKTLLARAVAGEANANFLNMSGSEFVEMFIGVGAARVRDLFNQGKQSAPAIIFIDELDAVGRRRGAGLGGGHDEREQTLNQILVEMDGFNQRESIILIAATNRPDILDPALLRPGRFDRKVYTNLPDIEDRIAILKVHTRNKPLAENVCLKIIARGTPMFSGADLKNLANEAALRAARKNKDEIEMEDFEWAKEKVLLGAEKKIIIADEEKQTIAFHEAGHALVAKLCPKADPLHKVSIIPRGQSLGVTIQLPLQDKHLYSKEELESKLIVLMGGRVAEEIFLNKSTTGASNDIEVATGIARKMVCDFGMSDLGPLSFGEKQGEIFLGKDLRQIRNYSEDTAKRIDKAVENLVNGAYQKAKDILEKNKDKVKKLVKVLLERETLDGKEVKKILKTKTAQ